MPVVVLVGTLDTKAEEYEYLRDCLVTAGCEVLLVDAGVLGASAAAADVTREAVARAAGRDLDELRAANDRGAAMQAMASGAAIVARALHETGRLHGILAAGGSGGSSVATAAMRGLPIGVPKLMVSTIASSDVRSYVGESDIAMLFPVLDIAGLNTITRRILGNAASAMAGMAALCESQGPIRQTRPVVAISMFGVTTPAVSVARAWLEQAGYEVLVFHANGAGGRAMERLIGDGVVRGCLDLTTTELADELVGGRMSAGPDRLEAAGRLGIPQVVSLGALDMVNFGAIGDVPERFRERRLYRHNPNVTLMRTNAAETAILGRTVAGKLNLATGPTCLFVPLAGISAIARAGEVFFDPDADRALVDALLPSLDPRVKVVEVDTDINDPALALAMARQLHEYISTATAG